MKKICFISSTRADYGLLYWTMKNVQEEPDLRLQLIVTGMHLDPRFGDTWRIIEKDGFTIDKKISLGELGDSSFSVIQQISTGLPSFTKAFSEMAPDLVVILGDRYEMLAVAQAAFFLGIPIAHIAGGEITEGAFDDHVRHSFTKLSSYHFTSTERYRKRVIQMGERPERVFNVGALGLENFKRFKLLSREEIENRLNFKLKRKNFLITYHPVTAVNEDGVDELINALKSFGDVGQIITMPNSDPGFSKIVESFSSYAKMRENIYLTSNLGSLLYLSIMKISDAVIGNSSSGIAEAPFVGVPTLNIGARQKGRIHADSVINCTPDEIKQKIEYILSNQYHESELYGAGDSSEKLLSFFKVENFTIKSGFYDL
jgi:UDP-hydrolysing UDP-N-acetyl-D-glucosamine 2-epimerase